MSLADRSKFRRALVLCLCTALLSLQSFAAPPAVAKLVPPKDSSPWVGQKWTFAIDVAVQGRFAGSTRLDLPEVPGAILMKPEERPVLSSKTVDDQEYVVQQHGFALFCQQGDAITVPEIRVRCGSIRVFGQPAQEHTLTVPAFKVTPQVPKGARPGKVVVVTTNFEVEEKWDARPKELKVGDAFSRTVTLRAADVPGMLLPPLPQTKLEGLAAYPRTPDIEDKTERGAFTGQRRQTVTWVCETAGEYELPEVTFRWYDPDEKAWKTKSLDAVSFEVKPRTQVADSASTKPSSRAKAVAGKGNSLLLFGGLMLVGLLAAVSFLTIRRKRTVEQERFAVLMDACRRNDAKGAYNAHGSWRGTLDETSDATWADLMESHKLAREWMNLQRAMLDPDRTWQGQQLARALKRARAFLGSKRMQTPRVVLPPMNPPSPR